MGLVVTNEDSGVSTVIVGPDASTNALAPDINGLLCAYSRSLVLYANQAIIGRVGR